MHPFSTLLRELAYLSNFKIEPVSRIIENGDIFMLWILDVLKDQVIILIEEGSLSERPGRQIPPSPVLGF
jgi:hypothetical protein